MSPKQKIIVGIFTLAGLCVYIFTKFSQAQNWSSLVLDGGVVTPIIKAKDTIIAGTTYSNLYLIDQKQKFKISKLNLNTGDVVPQVVDNNRTLVIAGNTLYLVDNTKNTMIWQQSADDNYFFIKALIHKGYVLAPSTNGALTAYNLENGREIWKFKPKSLEKFSDLLFQNSLKYFGNLTPSGNLVYVASQDHTLYALDLKTGRQNWEKAIGELSLAGPKILGKYLVLTTEGNRTLVFDTKSQEIIWEASHSSPTSCIDVSTSLKSSNNLGAKVLNKIEEATNHKLIISQSSLFELLENGTFIKKDLTTGKIIWELTNLGRGFQCPKIFKDTALLSSTKGKLMVISLTDGHKILEVDNFKSANSLDIISTKIRSLSLGSLGLYQNRYLISNTAGELFLVSSRNGTIVWKFSAGAPVTTEPLVSKDNIFWATSDGVIHKINKHTGLPDIQKKDTQFTLTNQTKKVGSVDIYEFTLKSHATFDNPWRQAGIKAEFKHESGKLVTLPGFYYDNNQWKIRFNPPLKGGWTWKVFWTPHGKILTQEGELNSQTDTSEFFLRTNTTNPKRLTNNGKDIFNGIGIGDFFLDINYNGTPLDDWALGNSSPLRTSNSFQNLKYRSDKVNSTSDYLTTYGPSGAGFNIFRWSHMNVSPSLWKNFGYPTTYSFSEGKILDSFFEELRKENMHIWFTIFGFDIPFKGSPNPNDQFLQQSFVNYVLARYGAYVDIWELGNEVAIPRNTSEVLINQIRFLDYEKRPISISSFGFDLDLADITSPHWYETEDIRDSDIKTVAQIQALEKHKKPVIISEQGNHAKNFDELSADRMRIRSWTAFFNEGMLIFWNQSDTKEVEARFIHSSNIYLGDTERKYIKVLQDFSEHFPLETKTVEYNLTRFGVRGYGLTSEKVETAYFIHNQNPFTPTKFSLVISPPKNAKIDWVEPATGTVLKSEVCNLKKCTISSPSFKIDIAFKMTFYD